MGYGAQGDGVVCVHLKRFINVRRHQGLKIVNATQQDGPAYNVLRRSSVVSPAIDEQHGSEMGAG